MDEERLQYCVELLQRLRIYCQEARFYKSLRIKVQVDLDL